MNEKFGEKPLFHNFDPSEEGSKKEKAEKSHSPEKDLGETQEDAFTQESFDALVSEIKAEKEQEQAASNHTPQYVSLVYAKILAYRSLQDKKYNLPVSVEEEMQKLNTEMVEYEENAKGKKEFYEVLNREQRKTEFQFQARLEKGKKPMEILFPLIEENLRSRSADWTAGLSPGETYFTFTYGESLNAQLAAMLSEEMFEQYVNIQTPEDARQFLESKPLVGKKVAEMGGNATLALEDFGAEVDNPATLLRRSVDVTNIDQINLNTFQKLYPENNYDVVFSHMVFDAGSGIEYTRPEYTSREKRHLAVIELHSVFNKLLKVDGLSMHVGGHIMRNFPMKVLEDGQQKQRILNLFLDGQFDKFRQFDERDLLGPEFPSALSMFEAETGFMKHKLGFEPLVWNGPSVGPGDLILLKKTAPTKLNSLSDIINTF